MEVQHDTVCCDFRTNGVSGCIKINGRQRNVQKFRKQSSYITQEFAILELLKVRETLVVAADLKLDSHVGKETKNELVSNVSVKMTTLWHVTACSLIKVDQHFRGAYYMHSSFWWWGSMHPWNVGLLLLKSWWYILEYCYLYTRHHESMKSYSECFTGEAHGGLNKAK